MVALRRTLFALVLAAVGCGDDDDRQGTMRLDGGIDSGIMADGSVAAPDAATPSPDASTPGATSCTTSTLPAAGMCGGLHCNETQAQLKAGLSAAGACKTDDEVAALCSLTAVNESRMCGLMNLTDVAARATCAAGRLPQLSSGCLNCYLTAVQCAAERCLSPCATGNQVACDTCRVQMGCVSEFYTCAGFRNPLQR